MINYIWLGMIALSILCAALNGRLDQLSTALLDGASGAVELSLFLLGSMCAWMGFLRIAEESGLTRLLARCFSPVIDRLFPDYREEAELKGKICMNLTANLLGLGNAATPLGIQAARRMAQGCGGIASDELCILVVLNTASIQLLPTTIASVRSAMGSTAPFDILPAIWFSSLLSLIAGLSAAKLLSLRKRARP